MPGYSSYAWGSPLLVLVPIFVATCSTECKISLKHDSAVERRCGYPSYAWGSHLLVLVPYRPVKPGVTDCWVATHSGMKWCTSRQSQQKMSFWEWETKTQPLPPVRTLWYALIELLQNLLPWQLHSRMSMWAYSNKILLCASR